MSKTGATAPKVTLWRPPELDGVEALRGDGVIHPHSLHWHDELHICLIEAGAGVLVHRGTSHQTARGDLFIVPPGEVHANHSLVESGVSFRTINVALRLASAAELGSSLAGLAVLVTSRPLLVSDFRRAHESLSRRSPLEQETLLLSLLVKLVGCFSHRLPRVPRAGREPTAVGHVEEYLRANLERNVTLVELSRLSGLSPFHLIRAFKRAFGLPPHAYQVGARIVRARHLLRQGCPIAEVAAWVGFADQAHFSRHFKRQVGISPGQYRSASKNVQDTPLQRPLL